MLNPSYKAKDPIVSADFNVLIQTILDLQNAGYGVGSSILGWVAVDSFPGATDSAKLANAMSYASAQTQKPILRLSNRAYTFDQSIGVPYDGFCLVGSGFGQLDVKSTTRNVNHTTVKLAVPTASGLSVAPWIHVPPESATTSYDGYIAGINFYADANNQVFIRCPYPSQMRIWTFENLAFQGLYGVFGTGDEQMAHTICNYTGGFYIANCRYSGVGFRGSDSLSIWPNSINLYQSSAYGVGNEKWSLVFNALGKSAAPKMYVTAFGGYRGVKIMGSRNNGRLVIGGVIEGDKNTVASSCNGSLLRIEGGIVAIRDLTVDCGMVNPSGTAAQNSNGIADRALVEIMGSATDVTIDGMDFGHSVGIDVTTMPCIRVSNGAKVRIRNLSKFQRDGGGAAWGTNEPRIEQSTSGLITDWDSTVVVDPVTNKPFVVA